MRRPNLRGVPRELPAFIQGMFSRSPMLRSRALTILRDNFGGDVERALDLMTKPHPHNPQRIILKETWSAVRYGKKDRQ